MVKISDATFATPPKRSASVEKQISPATCTIPTATYARPGGGAMLRRATASTKNSASAPPPTRNAPNHHGSIATAAILSGTQL